MNPNPRAAATNRNAPAKHETTSDKIGETANTKKATVACLAILC
jgi:hypothetical protein